MLAIKDVSNSKEMSDIFQKEQYLYREIFYKLSFLKDTTLYKYGLNRKNSFSCTYIKHFLRKQK